MLVENKTGKMFSGTDIIDPNHSAAMLSLRRIKSFVFAR